MPSPSKRIVTPRDVAGAARQLTLRITASLGHSIRNEILVYGVPRGGIPAAFAVVAATRSLGLVGRVVDQPEQATVIVDDLVDSGKTRDRYQARFPDKPFFALFEKTNHAEWFVFPWEVSADGNDVSKLDIPLRMLEAIGEDVSREGLTETPKRVIKAWEHWFCGYRQDPAAVLKMFEDGAEGADEMVLETDIPVYSFCEHHMAPIFGVAHVAYIPRGKVVGLSKLVRVVDIFARRLQVQERLTNDVANALDAHLKPAGVGVILQCRHMCMESRGINRPGVVTTTSALRGALKDEASARAEFMSLVEMSKSRHNSIL